MCVQCKEKEKLKPHNFCRDCFNQRKRETYKRGICRNPFQRRLSKLKAHCKSSNIKCDLDAEYLASIWSGICPIFNIELSFVRKDITDKADNCADLDRFKPELGYVKGNVTWISTRANRIKYDATVEELEKILYWMKNRSLPEQREDIDNIIIDGISLKERKKIPRPQIWNKGKKLGRNLKMSSINNPNAKLTIEQVRAIRSKYTGKHGEIKKLSDEYGLSRSNIKLIVLNKSYIESDGSNNGIQTKE